MSNSIIYTSIFGEYDKVVEQKPSVILVQDTNNKDIGYISSKRLSEILKK